MREVQEINRSLVSIFDIEGFSRRSNPQQAALVSSFVDVIEQHLQALSPLHPDVFSTGDGAIVSLGRSCAIDAPSVTGFMTFVIEAMTHLLKEGVIIRTAVHYSERDSIIPLANSPFFKGGYIQIGDTINHATRILGFCEPRELMISDATYQLLQRVSLDVGSYHRNDPFFTKHGELLRTFTYSPDEAGSKYFYHPDSPWHPYKKYSYFPPVKSDTLEYFANNGLGRELQLVISHAYDAWRLLSDTMSFLSNNNVMQVLCQLQYDPTDKLYVLSRNDIRGFWEQVRIDTYIQRMKARTTARNPYVNQVRIMVFDKERDDASLMPNTKMFEALESLHATNSFFRYPSDMLRSKYSRLEELRFGFTVSTKHQYAIVPIPAPDPIAADELRGGRLGAMLSKYTEYNPSDGPMKAIITADKSLVSWLIREFEELTHDQDIEVIK
jgi:hypothetical protein